MTLTENQKRQRAEQTLGLIDLTTLNNDDSIDSIQALCDNASHQSLTVAALCVFPEWVYASQQELTKRQLTLPVATVTNFPEGHANVARAVAETERAVAAGANEIDVVMPYQALMAGDQEVARELVEAVKQACKSQASLKVIIESGELKSAELIRQASEIAIAAGADFIKTSTGKVPTNATLEAAAIMLQAIKDSGRDCGFKAAGGIRDLAQAVEYIELAEKIMGADWVSAKHFRIGASSLVGDLVQHLSATES